MSETSFEVRVERALHGVSSWLEANDYRAYDPGDGENSFLSHLTFKRHFLRRSLTAAVLRTPFEIRPWIGIKPHTSTKGMGYIGWGYAKLYNATKVPEYRDRARRCFDWLIEHRSPGHEHFCWGNHFSFSTRAGSIEKYTPTIVWSGLIGMAFLEAFHAFGEQRYLDVAASTAEWVKTLPREATDSGVCLSYIPNRQSSIHNSNMLGAALLAAVSSVTCDAEARSLATRAMSYSCFHQNDDGSWFYGVDPKYHWIDSFHTGYMLDSLKRFEKATGDTQFSSALSKGYAYFRRNFVEESGRPMYYHDRAMPIDIQCAAQIIDTFAFFSEEDPGGLEAAQRVAAWTIANMQDRDGHFYYRDLGWKKIRTPMLHWGQGTMLKALAHLLGKLRESSRIEADPSSVCQEISPVRV